MLVGFYFPFSDLRPLALADFMRLSRPNWPFPSPGSDYMRGLGGITYRVKPGFDGWVGEDRLAVGGPALRLQLPYKDATTGGRIRLIRKAAYFDGLLNGRVELIFSIDASPALSGEDITAIARRFSEIPVKVRGFDGASTLRDLTNFVPSLWAGATVKRAADASAASVRAGRPIVVFEHDLPLSGTRAIRRADEPGGPRIEMKIDRGLEVFLISARTPDDHLQRRTVFRSEARHVRTYTLRMLQNVEALSLAFSLPLDDLHRDKARSDSFQLLLNEYTRQINRSRHNVQNEENGGIISYCYAAFGRLYPGKVGALRIEIQKQKLRPSITRKILQMLDASSASAEFVSVTYQTEFNMGDKYENIDVSNSQGIAIGRGASADVRDSLNKIAAAEDLAAALAALSQHVAQMSDQQDSAVEAEIVKSASESAKKGDEEGAAGWLRKSAKWVIDTATSAGSKILIEFLKAKLGLPL